MARRKPGLTFESRLRALGSDVGLALVQSGLMTVFLAHQAWLMGDAIVRTLVRLAVTRRRLLEWTPAAQAAFGPHPGVARFYRRMAGALVIGAGAVAVAWFWGRGAWPIAAVFAAAWFASPGVALWASLSPKIAGRRPIAEDDARSLRLIARRTWRFFETFVTPDEHHLPPDNFQEIPEPVVAHRTSPTNMGLYLLSVASARDFGWIGAVGRGGTPGGDVVDHGPAAAPSAAISSTGTTPRTCGRSTRATSRRWTAAIWPAT